MLIRYPGLTIVGTAGLAVALAMAMGTSILVGTLLNPSLPFHEGERIVSLQLWNADTNAAVTRVSTEYQEWRSRLGTIRPLSAFRQATRNLIPADRPPQVVRVAEMSASGFDLARVPPFLGRHLTAADERRGAAPVVVLGYNEWTVRFAADPSIVGRTVRFGAVPHTVIGVMPEGFAFPVNHQFWVPLQLDATNLRRLAGPELMLFGRIAEGATLASAQAELSTIGRQLSTDFPSEYARLQPRVLPYTYPFSDMEEPENQLGMRLLQILVGVVLGLVAVNVSILVYARTATRATEIAVRTALGASRGRIVAQLFVEALALALIAVAAALWIVSMSLEWVTAALFPVMGQLPFWFDLGIKPSVTACGIVLAVATAAVIGVAPALKVTRSGGERRMRETAAVRLGTTWTMLIVGQVAIASALLPTVVYHASYSVEQGRGGPGFPAHEFLGARVVLDSDVPARHAGRLTDLLSRLRTDPEVRGATFSLAAPGEEGVVWVAIEGVVNPGAADDYRVAAGSPVGHQVRMNAVEPGWMDVFGVPLLTGRPLANADASDDTVVVNRSFVDRLLPARGALGARVRYVGVSGDVDPAAVELARWFRIVGVVEDFPVDPAGRSQPRMYQAALAGDVSRPLLAVHTHGDEAGRFTNRLRELAAAVDPSMQLQAVDRLDAPARAARSFYWMFALGLLAVTASVVLLSAAGIYAMMSCTVSQRRKEIGIRTALGGHQRRILAAIFVRAFGQLGAGAALGMAIAWQVPPDPAPMPGYGTVVVPIVAVLLVAVGLAAALGPARRALRVSPTEALRAE